MRAGVLMLAVPVTLAFSYVSATAHQVPPQVRGDVVSVATSAPPITSPFAANSGHVDAPRVVEAPRVAEVRQEQRTLRWQGAVIGAAVGAAATYFLLRHGDSTAPCDRAANQDALSRGECAGLTVAGAVAGGAVGYVIGGRIRVGSR